jgi:hypothetical protein
MLIAMPQCAIAQLGSAFAIRSNCGCASAYQKSCSSATPRSNDACSPGEHETENETAPSRSPAVSPALIGGGVAVWANAPQAEAAKRQSVKVFMRAEL